MNNSILNYWKNLKNKSVRNVEIARGILYLIFFVQIINALVGIYNSPLIGIIYFVVYFPLIFLIRQDLSKDFDNLMSDDFSKPIDIDTFNINLKLMIDEALEKFDISEQIEYYISINNFDYSPFVFSRTKVNFLVLPLGFFKLMYERPQEAKAILAHELSHIAQHDTDLTIFIKIFLKYVFAILLPIQLLILSPILYYSYQSSKEYRQEASDYNNAMFANGGAGISYYQDMISDSYANAKQSEKIYWGVLFSLVVLFLLYGYLRLITYNSEKTADVGAAAITNTSAIESIISRVLDDRKYKKRKKFWFTVNPSVDWRLRKALLLGKKFN
jgi:Peptidase family M48